jgi:tetratricopeptide (TPR) repeat protein
MSAEAKKEIQLEIAHVLFIDIVGYSKLLITEQSELLRRLSDVVRETEQFRAADAEGKLVRLPTGDGMALVFRNSPEAPVQCALELSKRLKAHPELKVRMGIHSGPVNEVADVNERANITGAGINVAQRVKPDPALGYINGELRFYLGWAQEVAGDHAAAQENWRQARSGLEPFLKEQRENSALIGDLALTNMGLGDKAAAFELIKQGMAVVPIEKDAMDGPQPIEILARVAAQTGEPDRAIAALQKLLSIPYESQLASNVPLTPALLRLDPMFDPLRNDPRFQKLVASSAPKTADK